MGVRPPKRYWTSILGFQAHNLITLYVGFCSPNGFQGFIGFGAYCFLHRVVVVSISLLGEGGGRPSGLRVPARNFASSCLPSETRAILAIFEARDRRTDYKP